MFTLRREDLAWAAGFFDGEGCTSFNVLIKNGNPYRKLGLAVGQKQDPSGTHETLTKFMRIVGVGKIYPARGTDKFQYGTGKFCDVQHILCLLWPWLSTRKREQALGVLKRYHDHELKHWKNRSVA